MLASLALLEAVGLSVAEAVCVVNRMGAGLAALRQRGVTLHALLTEPSIEDGVDVRGAARAGR
jgi:orotate phosphoribosyltransferase